jgi:PAS domain S-box-containing protein
MKRDGRSIPESCSSCQPDNRLRQHAEKILKEGKTVPSAGPIPGNMEEALHELRLMQIEKELLCDELSQAKAELEKNQTFLGDVIENSGALVFVKDRDGRYQLVNRKWLEVTGFEREDVLGSTDAMLFPAPIAEQFRANDLEAMTLDAVVEKEETLEDENGRQYFISIKFPLRDENGSVIGICGMTTDITKRKEAEQALAREREFIDAIFNSVPGMLYLYDAEGRLVRWNKKHETMTGYTAEELSGMQLFDWYKGDKKSQAAVTKGVQTTFEKGFGEAEAELQKKDGTTIPMYFTASTLSLDDKQYFTGIGIDITERKRTETEREKLQFQLVQAQKMEAIGRLAGGVAHDFNNMLGVILGHVELALKTISPENPLSGHLHEIHKAADRSANLTRQLLGFARRQAISPRILDFNETVGGALKMLQRLIGEDIDLVWEPTDDLCLVKMDPSQVDQILANLCINARDAISGVGKVSIKTRLAVFDRKRCSNHPGIAPGEYVRLTVRDDGRGIDKEILDKLFEPFFTTKDIGKGTGLGLATVYGIVRQNNGSIDVYSEPGMGTTFEVYLPRHKGAIDRPPHNGNGDRVCGGHETILLVEDEPAILAVSASMLELLGYKVLAAGTPGAAIELAQKHRGEIDLLMTDVVMPKMNGRELVDRLRKLNLKFKTLFMSGYTINVISHHRGLDEGVHFIQKPFSHENLAVKVRETLESDSNL